MNNLDLHAMKLVSGGTTIEGTKYVPYSVAYNSPPHLFTPCIMVPVIDNPDYPAFSDNKYIVIDTKHFVIDTKHFDIDMF